ncbi:MAG TPA: hypothetical protein VKP08_18390 [Anaerolineales bacterium]|nr:hypothetical protein [Anaerolineales bacterium]
MNKPVYDVQHQVQAAFMNDPDVRDYDIEVLDSNGIARAMYDVMNVINELNVI